MNILYRPELIDDLKDQTLLLDTCSLIDASKNKFFFDFLSKLIENGCAFVTLQSVIYEFTRSAKTKVEYDDCFEFIKQLKIEVFDFTKVLSQQKDFQFQYNKNFDGKAKPSYTDAQLCSTVAFFAQTEPIKLLTANYKDVPLKLFKRDDVIVFENANEIRTEAIYSYRMTN